MDSKSNYRVRWFVLVSYLALFLLLGIPFWYKLTTIYRADIPVGYIKQLTDDNLSDLHITLPIYVAYQGKDTEFQLDTLIKNIQTHIDRTSADMSVDGVETDIKVLPINKNILESKGESLYHILRIIDGDDSPLEIIKRNEFISSFDTTVKVGTLSQNQDRTVEYISDVIVNYIFGLTSSNDESIKAYSDGISIPYTPKVHLGITLLTGDGDPVGWDIETSTSKYITPLRELLSSIYNFTVDTNIIYYNDLNLKGQETLDESTLSHIIDISEVSSNDEYSEQIGVNLAIIFPSRNSASSGLDFINSTTISLQQGDNTEVFDISWEKFFVPRWGSLVINKYALKPNSYLDDNYLKPIMHKFSIDLLKIIGIDCKVMSPYNSLNAFKRSIVFKNLHKATETLQSLVRLTESFTQMAIPEQVRQDVNTAIELREKIVSLINSTGSSDKTNALNVWDEIVLLSNTLVEVCENAFFDNEMVQQNFFPDEHKTAVYFPLIGPIAMVLVLGIISFIKERNSISIREK